jgi:hypothetical protein
MAAINGMAAWRLSSSRTVGPVAMLAMDKPLDQRLSPRTSAARLIAGGRASFGRDLRARFLR